MMEPLNIRLWIWKALSSRVRITALGDTTEDSSAISEGVMNEAEGEVSDAACLSSIGILTIAG